MMFTMARQLSADLDVESLRHPSWCLCRLLEIEVGTKEEVSLRRKCDAMSYFVRDNNMSHKILYSGSRGEGFNFQSSDYDYMYIDVNTTVLESIKRIRQNDNRKTLLLMTKGGCNPGFCILRLLNTTNDREIRESVVDFHGHPVVSSLLYRDAHREAEYDQVGHGPCNTHYYGAEFDKANCFECSMWPSEASEFIHRLRPHGWPQKALLDKIICRGCHLVPIGDKFSDLSYIQWRLSFSAAEKDLVHAFNHTQFLVYGLMKIFLKQCINKFQSVKNVLCSYFLKTAMFYSIESTPPSFWRDDLLIHCFWFCFNKLIQWVEQGYCPNYFVIQNNMFRSKVFGEIQRNLLVVLNQCRRIGWKCIYLCEGWQSIERIINHSRSLFTSALVISERDCEYSLDLISSTMAFKFVYNSQENMQKNLGRSFTLLINSRTQEEKELSTLALYGVFKCTGPSIVGTDVSTNNKDKYKTMRMCQRFILVSSQNCGPDGLVSLATFYYATGQYKKAIQTLERVLLVWKPYVMHHSYEHRKTYNDDLYHQYVTGRGKCLIDKLKSALTHDVCVTEINEKIFPTELLPDREAAVPFFLYMPPLPYTVFMLFLCNHKLGNIDSSIANLHDLEVLSRDRVQGLKQYPVVLNMLAICLQKLGDIPRAVEMCLLSQELKPNRNGAEKLLDRILSKLN